MLKIEIPKSKEKIKGQIEALKYQLTQDSRNIDKQIHEQALKRLEEAFKTI
ncbi:hypothetical protein CLOBY_17820 [Clostridium saccharobutylicum]|uniref:hypothetical protein n=1 Tax=Clostridium saccharobutylicum TaxID=169679 RepID=UPI000983FF08|nr:hypothetical protein [Clostridium saccharobutylicum]AQS09651.1 hypothetical protein CLOBY_17820 [Clostridium saccharobutylicum]MBC2438813.1 hypothetical protein [Clostridium saccharobutylicum]NSB91094.1 hypothetical protein [Clostridium saccharobutylicum]NYC27961.1 hypothetical protein [Clostridium saccharobutylicum]OOM12960.1 hypothetical protein CLSAB_36510 [Clostridium saccharobutylicum]